MRRISITDKLLLASLLISILTIVIVASYSFYNARDAILERTFDQLTTVRAVKTSLLENFLENRLREVELVSSSSDFKDIVNTLVVKHDTSESNLLLGHKPLLKSITSRYFSSVFIFTRTTGIVGLYGEKRTLSQFSKISERIDIKRNSEIKPTFVDMFSSDSIHSPFIYIVSSLNQTKVNDPVIIVLEIPIDPIDSIMLELDESAGLGTSGETYIVGNDKLFRSSSRFESNSILNTYVDTKAVNQAFNGNVGTGVIEDYRGVEVLSSWGKIKVPGLNWVLIAEIDFEEATIPIYRIRNEIEFISIFIFFLVLVVVFIFSRRITLPIQRLNEATISLGKGNYDVNIKHRLKDELGDLTDTFNIMVEKLKEQAQELEHERLNSLTSLINGQESERQRLSRELHDGLGQLLIALKLRFESCIMNEISKSAENQKLLDMSALFNKTIDETRRMSNNLMPAVLSEFGLVSAIRDMCNTISDTANIPISFRSDGFDLSLDARYSIYIFRIIQESLTNIIKHSQAELASVNLRNSGDLIILKIEDDGIGFDPKMVDYSKSNGLNNIKNRVSLLKGTFDIQSKVGRGTKIFININIHSGIENH